MDHLKNLLIVYLIALAAIFSSCDKNKNDKPGENNPAITPTGTFLFHLHTFIDNDEVDLYNITYTTLAGRGISLSMAQLYISDIQLIKADGSAYLISGKNLLKVFELETYFAGIVPVGNYKSIRFKVGLDSIVNAKNPPAYADTAILNKKEMWFGSSAQPDGYVFMNVQGTIDTTSDMSGSSIPFIYKIGGNANYTQITLPDRNFTIVKDQVEYGHIYIDYSLLFNGIPLNQINNLSVKTKADNASALAKKIAGNIPAMFKYE